MPNDTPVRGVANRFRYVTGEDEVERGWPSSALRLWDRLPALTRWRSWGRKSSGGAPPDGVWHPACSPLHARINYVYARQGPTA